MAQTQQELLTAIHAAEAELELMAGYEDQYPEHYEELLRTLVRAEDAYAEAMANAAPFAPQAREATPTTYQMHVADQDTILVAGRGDRIVLINADLADEEPDEEQPSAGQPGQPPPPAQEVGPAPTPPPQEVAPAPAPPPQSDEATETDDYPPGPPAPQSLEIVKVEADAWKQGYGNFRLRSDVAEYYNKVRDEATRRGAIITSSGGLRDLNATVGAGRSATSFHYSGRALDLFLYSGMVDPKKDPYVVVREEARVYRVYARCSDEHAEVKELSNVMSYYKRDGSLTASGSFFDLTALFKKHGFERIRARSDFESGGNQIGAEWWHFQFELGLVPGQSKFGDELLGVYSEATLKPTPPWQYRDYVFGVNWG